MKIKGLIKNLKIKKIKSDNSKNISRNFSRAVVDSVGSIQFPIVPCSSLQLFSRPLGPRQCLVNANCRVLFCGTCHFHSSPPPLFILSSSFCRSPQCLISALTQGGRRWSLIQAHLFSCVVGREGCCKYRWRGQGVFAGCGPHWVCASSRWHVLPGSTLLRLQGLCRGTVQSSPCVSCTSLV